MNLFIIGNGFDKALKLPTDYRDNLRPILKDMDKDKFECINKLYFSGYEDLWSEFENNIGNIKDYKIIYDNLENITNQIQTFNNEYSNPFVGAYGIESESYGASDIEVDNAINSVNLNKPNADDFDIDFQNLKEFVDKGMDKMIEVADKELNDEYEYPIIKNLNSNSMFLTFNYTDTLEKACHISSERILHIHGTLDDELIVVMKYQK